MNKEKTYILQKDLPNGKAGDEWRWHAMAGGYAPYYIKSRSYEQSMLMSLPREYVEDNPDWFKIKEEEKPKVINIEERHNVFLCRIHTIGKDVRVVSISKEHLAEILIAENKGELFINGNEQVWLRFGKEKLYTEKEWLQFGEECFSAARKNNSEWYYLYQTFSDYMNELQK